MFEVDLGKIERRTFINDMESDIVHLTPMGENSTRLSVIFETNGKEIKRYEKGGLGKDKIMSDWQIEGPRVDITFKLINNDVFTRLPLRLSLNQYNQNPFQSGCEVPGTLGCGTGRLGQGNTAPSVVCIGRTGLAAPSQCRAVQEHDRH